MRKSIIGGLGVGSGMAIFVAVSPPTGGVSPPSLLAQAPALAGITALIMLSAFVALRARGIANVIWLAAATVVIYAFVNAVTKSGVDLLTSRGAGVLATWKPYALTAAGILSGWFGQSAFNAGPLSLGLPVIDTVEPVCSVILAAAVFHEHLARSPGLLAFQLAGGAIAAAGIAVLSYSPVVLAEERRQSRSARLPQINGAAERQAFFRGGGLLATRSVELLAETPAAGTHRVGAAMPVTTGDLVPLRHLRAIELRIWLRGAYWVRSSR